MNAAAKTWANTGTDFNTGSNWGGTVPTTSDVATFNSAATQQPNISGNIAISALDFVGAGTGYTVSSADANTALTLMSTSSSANLASISAYANTTISAPIVFGAAASSTQTILLGTNATTGYGVLTLNGVISSTNSITLNITGSSSSGIIFNAANTYTGGTTIGVTSNVTIGNKAAFSSGTVNISNTSKLLSGTTLTGANAIANNFVLTNSSAASITVNAIGGAMEFSGGFNLGGVARTINFTGANTTTFSGVLSNDGGAGLSFAGTTSGSSIVLSGLSTYTGNTTISGSSNTHKISVSTIGDAGSSGNLGAGSKITLGSGSNQGVLQYTGSGESSNRLLDMGSTTGNATIEAAGTGALVFTNANVTASGAGSKTLVLTGTSTAANEIKGSIVDNSGSNLTSLSKSSSGMWIVSGSNSYSGGTTIGGGTLGFSNGSLGSTGSVTMNGGTLLWNGSNTQDVSSRLVLVNGTNAKFDTNGNNVTFVSTIGGGTSANLVKTGAGKLTLAAANTYTGTTTISAGTLALTGGLTNSSLIVNNGTLDVTGIGGGLILGGGQTLQGTGTVVGNTTINGTLSPGNSPGVMTFNDNLTLGGTANFQINGLVRGTDYDGVDVGGTLTYGGVLAIDFGTLSPDGTDYQLFNFTTGETGSFTSIGITGSYMIATLTDNSGVWSGTADGLNFTFNQATGILNVASPTPVPEPATFAAMAGVLVLGLVAWRRRHARV